MWRLISALLVLSDASLLAHYKFWASYGQVVPDSSGNGFHAVNGASSAAGGDDGVPTSRGIYLPQGARVTLPPNDKVPAPLDVGKAFTLTAWIKVQSSADADLRLFQWTGGQRTIAWRLDMDIIKVQLNDGSGTREMKCPIPNFASNQWRFVYVIVDVTSGTTSFEMDPTFNSCGQQAGAFDYLNSATSIAIQANKDSAIYELRIYNHKLTQTEISALYKENGSGNCVCPNNRCAIEPSVLCLPACQSYSVLDDCQTGCQCQGAGCIGSAAICAVCHQSCASGACTGPASTDCVSLCHQSCRTCSAPTSHDCTACSSQYAAVVGGTCTCTAGYYLANANTGSCATCHSTCASCSGSGAHECLTCRDFAALAGAAPNQCTCVPAAYQSQSNPSQCLPCHSKCKTCSGGTDTDCLSCPDLASLSASHSCTCNAGYFPLDSECWKCGQGCATCESFSVCTTCLSNARLENFSCVCEDKFYGDPGNCLPCEQGCELCSKHSCLKCAAGLFFHGKSCVQTCPSGFHSTSTTCAPVTGTPPLPELTVHPDNSLSVNFDQAMDCAISAADIYVAAYALSGKIIDVSWKPPYFQGKRTLHIDLVFETQWIPPESTVVLVFLSPATVTSASGVPIDQDTLKGTLVESGKAPLSASNSLRHSAHFASVFVKTALSLLAVTSVINASYSPLLSFVNNLQLCTYISMSTLPLPVDFASTLSALNVEFLVSDLLQLHYTDGDRSLTPQHVVDYGIPSVLFVVNILPIVGVCTVMLGLFLVAYGLGKSRMEGVRQCRRIAERYRWGIPIELWLTSYLDSAVFACLQVAAPGYANDGLIAFGSVVLAGAVLAVLAVTLLLLILFTHTRLRREDITSRISFQSRWGKLFLRPSAPPIKFAYFPLFLLRRLLLAATLAFASDSQVTLVIANIAMSACVIAIQVLLFLVSVRPFATRLDNIEVLIAEGSPAVVYLLAGLSLVVTGEAAVRLGTVGKWTVVAIVAGSVVLAVFRTLSRMATAYLKKAKSVQSKVHPEKAPRLYGS